MSFIEYATTFGYISVSSVMRPRLAFLGNVRDFFVVLVHIGFDTATNEGESERGEENNC